MNPSCLEEKEAACFRREEAGFSVSNWELKQIEIVKNRERKDEAASAAENNFL